ncbi:MULTISPECIES: hypothetical protein [Streptomyces]|uniref:Uncharacterized protein n=1 Tax=Streptomyces gougerotii TaxID=53448 RepID=A0A8H9LU29_9ACTN|nr:MULTISPECIES: hypothetical protein [Streptomyces]MDQ0297469.1 hypothetical protein [Streptomyces sp. DSM 41037]GFH81499.1 hypothetical protein Sgou_61690 [Streptomyces gougerotii]GGU92309.1 hypothetical protein GCM10010227_54570 [Streptomyces gougerotii]
MLLQRKTPSGVWHSSWPLSTPCPSTISGTVLTGDLDLARGILVIRRGLRRHTLYLEELTHQTVADWLDFRHRRWPASTSPRLLVSQRSTLDPDHPAVGKTRSVSMCRQASPWCVCVRTVLST